VIKFHDVTKEYGGHRVLGPVSGRIEAGGITALIGPNGAGKSTLLSIVGRLMQPTSGGASVDGLDVRTAPTRELATRLAILSQEHRLDARITVRDLVAFGRFPHTQGRLTFGDHAHIDRALDFLELTGLQHRYLDELSGGQRQRAFVAMVLAQDTEVVLLDEPLNNLDLKHAVLIMRQLRRAADLLGRTIVIVIHDLAIAAAYADRVIALKQGQIAHSGTVEEVMTAEIVSELYETPVRILEVDGRRVPVVMP